MVATGKVEPRDEVLIKPQISGIVSDVYKEAGQMVRKGEVIATVKVVPEMGQLSSAESRVSVAEISLDQTRREFDRTEALHKKGVVSDEEYEQGRTALRKAQEELQNAKENMEIVKNGITSRYKELSNTPDPFDDRRSELLYHTAGDLRHDVTTQHTPYIIPLNVATRPQLFRSAHRYALTEGKIIFHNILRKIVLLPIV